MRVAQQRKALAGVLAAWRVELQSKMAARAAAEKLYHRASRARLCMAFNSLRENGELSCAAQGAAAAFAQRREARLCHAIAAQGIRQADCHVLHVHHAVRAWQWLLERSSCIQLSCSAEQLYADCARVWWGAQTTQKLSWWVLSAVWGAWRSAAEDAMRTKRLLQRYRARRQACALRAAMHAWQSVLQAQRAFRAQVQRMIDARGARLRQRGLLGWQEAAVACRQQRVRAVPGNPDFAMTRRLVVLHHGAYPFTYVSMRDNDLIAQSLDTWTGATRALVMLWSALLSHRHGCHLAGGCSGTHLPGVQG